MNQTGTSVVCEVAAVESVGCVVWVVEGAVHKPAVLPVVGGVPVELFHVGAVGVGGHEAGVAGVDC